MGRVLQVRVLAQTWNPDDVRKAWPNLHMLAWPEQRTGPDKKIEGPPRGVVEMVGVLADEIRFGDWEQDVVDELSDLIADAVRIKTELEAALADWRPQDANLLTDELEQVLTEMNALAPEAKETMWSKFKLTKKNA